MARELEFQFVTDPPCPIDDPFQDLEDMAAIFWPRLGSLGLSKVEIELRRTGIGGSDANTILSADPARILELWRVKRGECKPVDLSDKIAVMLGNWTEEFNRQWFERIQQTTISARGITLHCPKNNWRRSTLDGLVGDGEAIWEAKHTSAFASPDEVLERYMPQLQHNMAVARISRAYLSVIFGNHRFEIFEVASDWMYQLQLFDAEADFWDCVVTGRQPVPAPPIAPPKPNGIREVSLEGNNSWASAATDWLQHRDAAKLHSAAASTLKSLVEDDVSKAFGHGVEARRNKAGAISIRELTV